MIRRYCQIQQQWEEKLLQARKKVLTLKLGKNIGIYTLQNNWQNDLQQAWVWNWFLTCDSPGLARWSLEERMALSIGGKIKMNFKELMRGFICGQKRVLHLRRVGQVIFFVCSLVVKPYKIICIDMTDWARRLVSMQLWKHLGEMCFMALAQLPEAFWCVSEDKTR